MAGVKKSGGKDGRRGTARGVGGKIGKTGKTGKTGIRTKSTTGTTGTTGTVKTTRRVSTSKRSAPARTIVRIRELDPYRKCGLGTSVERLIRVDEEVSGRKEAHLVYLDRHGWYCEHGRTCHAVKHARKG